MSLASSVRGWAKLGQFGCPIELVSRDWGCPGCQRLVLIATACGRGDQDLYLGEFDSMADLNRSRHAYQAVITRTWNKATAA